MRDFFDRLQWRLASFMAGRNGIDKLAGVCVVIALILLVIEMFTNTVVLSLISLVFVTYALFRCYSRNTDKRAEENARFEEFLAAPTQIFRRRKDKGAQGRASGTKTPDTTALVFRCEQCGQSLSVPKGKGRIKVTCPRCRHQTLTKS